MTGAASRGKGHAAEALNLEVVGVPAPQGSKRHVGGGRMVESSKKVGPWRDAVAWTTRAAMAGRDPLDGPLSLAVIFRLPMPASRRKTDRERGWRWADRQPDLDKLLRSTLDGIVAGGGIADDARIVAAAASKIEVVEWIGAVVRIEAALATAKEVAS